jgi:hypothetical protein
MAAVRQRPMTRCRRAGVLICPTGKSLVLPNWGLSSPFCKNILFFRRPKSVVCLLPSRPTQRGGSRRHGRGAGCGGRGGALDGRCLQRMAKTCGPDTPTLVSSWRATADDGGKKADHRGERGISRKPLRAGMSGDFRWLAVNTRVHTYYPMRTRGCGCIGRPAFPTPSVFRADVFSKPRTHRAARMRSRVCGWLPFENLIGARNTLYVVPA